MEFDKVIQKRVSVREFKNKKVPWHKVLDAIDSALQGPFAGNTNNLRFIIVEDENTKKVMSKHSQQNWVEDAKFVIVVCSDPPKLERLYEERGEYYSRQQAGAAVNTIMLKLADLKIGSCWVGAYSDELLKQKLKIPGHIHIEAMIAVGYPKEKVKKPDKYTLENTIRWNTWDNENKPRKTLIE